MNTVDRATLLVIAGSTLVGSALALISGWAVLGRWSNEFGTGHKVPPESQQNTRFVTVTDEVLPCGTSVRVIRDRKTGTEFMVTRSGVAVLGKTEP